MTEAQYEKAAAVMLRCGSVIDAGTPTGSLNRQNRRLLALAREKGLDIQTFDPFETPL